MTVALTTGGNDGLIIGVCVSFDDAVDATWTNLTEVEDTTTGAGQINYSNAQQTVKATGLTTTSVGCDWTGTADTAMAASKW